ncbi:MAG: hypothetical protein NTW21_38255 [Verrucomicrobia bacterium]|nr:hypothetical protein [Verrucomicrobiota bacterium]
MGNNTGLIPLPGAPEPGHMYDNTAVPPSAWANFYYDHDNDPAFTSPEDTRGNSNFTLAPAVVVSGPGPQTLNFYVQSFSGGVGANFAANKYRLTGLEMELSHGSVVPLNVATGTPQVFPDPSGQEWGVTLNGVRLVGDIVQNIDSTPGGGADYHFSLTFTLGGSPGYAGWAATNAPTGGANDDYDGDGVYNGVEYVLGGDKDTNDLGKLPQSSTAGGDALFTFVRDQASIDGSTTLAVETSTDLVDWATPPSPYAVPSGSSSNNPGVSVAKDSPVAGMDTVTLRLQRAPDEKKFARLKVTVPQPSLAMVGRGGPPCRDTPLPTRDTFGSSATSRTTGPVVLPFSPLVA